MKKYLNAVSFCFFTLVITAKLLLFNYYAYQPVWIGIFEKLAVGCAISSLVFVFRDKRWMIPFLLFVDIWCIANLVYVRSNNLILDGFALTMAGGMNGFWDSILIFFQWQDLYFPMLTVFAALPYFFVGKIDRAPRFVPVVLLLAVVLNYAGVACTGNGFKLNVYSRVPREEIYGNKLLEEACRTSIMHTLVYVPLDYLQLIHGVYPAPLPMSEAQFDAMDKLTGQTTGPVTECPLLIVLVESLESWVINDYTMPNLYRFLSNEHVLYAPKVECQTVGAESADGQMIVVSGLLPTHEGATCFRFPHNEFPSLMKAQRNHSLIMLPHDETVWNQKEMSPAYKFDSTAFISPIDNILFAQIDSAVDAGYKAILAVTMSTHSPFKGGAGSHLQLPKNMPYGMYNYTRGFNVVDAGIKQLLDKIESDLIMQQYTVVITGDHTIFHKERRERFAHYAASHDHFPFMVDEGYVPLIVYSPKITHNTRINDRCYQSDIYPTIIHLTDAEEYYWHGFGVNILDSVARENRKYTEEWLFDLSDRVIMNDYFASKVSATESPE
ncbi:MAG: sulfatase-like hydrolase/transferase [Paludibacteraceae bacterium]|nr:sulfatase-like hydrolase/transferase [Paludibacteraceae bacterium]